MPTLSSMKCFIAHCDSLSKNLAHTHSIYPWCVQPLGEWSSSSKSATTRTTSSPDLDPAGHASTSVQDYNAVQQAECSADQATQPAAPLANIRSNVPSNVRSNVRSNVSRLVALGFSSAVCEEALNATGGPTSSHSLGR